MCCLTVKSKYTLLTEDFNWPDFESCNCFNLGQNVYLITYS